MEFPPQYSGCCWRGMGFSSQVHHSWWSHALAHGSPFPLWQRLPLAGSACAVCLGGGTALANFLFLPQVHHFVGGVVCSNSILESPLGKAGLLKVSLIHGLLLRSVLSRLSPTVADRGWGRLPYSCWFHSPLCSLCLLPDAQVSKIPSGPLGVRCWILQAPYRCFYSWMDA